MAMQSVYSKAHEGNGHDQIGQFASLQSSASWWGSLGSHQSVYGASCGQLIKPSSMENSTEQAAQKLDKPNTTHFSFFPGNYLVSLSFLFWLIVLFSS